MTTIATNNLSSDLLSTMNPSKAGPASGTADVQDRFLNLLVAQMRNQDPLNPLDNAQVTSQMAQLSTVSGIDKLNKTMESVLSGYQSNQTLQAASLIGHGVLSAGSSIAAGADTSYFGLSLPQSVDAVTVNIKDGSGNTVRSLELGAQSVGVHPFSWDGMASDGTRVPPGNYTFEVSARSGSEAVAATSLSFGIVSSVTSNAQGVRVNIGDRENISLADLQQIF